MISTKPGAVNGPTPGCVISRCAAGHFSTSCSIAWEMEAKPGFDSEIGNRGPTEKPRQTKPIQQVRPRINSYIVNSCSFLLFTVPGRGCYRARCENRYIGRRELRPERDKKAPARARTRSSSCHQTSWSFREYWHLRVAICSSQHSTFALSYIAGKSWLRL